MPLVGSPDWIAAVSKKSSGVCRMSDAFGLQALRQDHEIIGAVKMGPNPLS
jgi:hypothetical protein